MVGNERFKSLYCKHLRGGRGDAHASRWYSSTYVGVGESKKRANLSAGTAIAYRTNLLCAHAVGVAFDFRHISVTHFPIGAVRRSDHTKPTGVRLAVVGLPLLQDFPSPASVSPHFVRVSCRASFGAFVFHAQRIPRNARDTRKIAKYFQKDFHESR